MSYAVRNDGLGWRAVNGPDDVSVYETYSAEQPPPPQPPQPDHVQQVKAQIDAIERETLMNRAAREFLLEQAVRETTRDYNIDLTTTGNRELVQVLSAQLAVDMAGEGLRVLLLDETLAAGRAHPS